MESAAMTVVFRCQRPVERIPRPTGRLLTQLRCHSVSGETAKTLILRSRNALSSRTANATLVAGVELVGLRNARDKLMMLYVFNCWNISTPEAAARSASLFQTGWFVESLLTQTLIIHIIRTNRIPFLQSRSSWPLIGMSIVIMMTGIAIPFTHLGRYLGFTALPPLYWPLLALTLLCYVLLTQLVKMWLLRRKWI